ncbi:hypothetical protein rutana_101 [Salmonella phage rutana]|uniref:Uncharacterized protein n=11 Tax=Caudoviricetes TaxID=2731619 RepID=A0A6G8RF69_9CAUD|nr:hypothetical protein [Citrobacter portucalensis]YP_009805971.1 hypothetical protein HOT66_gp161 [Salmonella phage S147]YP_009858313.1 hypothetical protein HWD24_gp163 [Salmonella phage rokbiter]QIN93441.1 hypothetical protein vBSenS3_113 [Salmonella phage vB_SenS-3]QIN99877.1 hypothetical protein misterkot_97 [Salmonella phage misterkot]QIO00038.1 hypothetical protein ende_98 [Salmonella phage ende]QIO00370.1 hypothetical protein polluks_100 [Salmonella phage polluks]QIO01246.1 hypothetic
MNLGTTCIFDHREMCCPHILYVVHFAERLTLDEAREKMGGITGYDFREGEYFSIALDYIDNTRLYHLVQLGEETDEVKMAKDTLRRYRPQILERTLRGERSDPLFLKCYDADVNEYLGQQRFYTEIKEFVREKYDALLIDSRARRAAKNAEKSAKAALESQTKLNEIVK